MMRDSDCEADKLLKFLRIRDIEVQDQMASKLSEKQIMQISSVIMSKSITPHLGVPILFPSAHTCKWRKTLRINSKDGTSFLAKFLPPTTNKCCGLLLELLQHKNSLLSGFVKFF